MAAVAGALPRLAGAILLPEDNVGIWQTGDEAWEGARDGRAGGDAPKTRAQAVVMALRQAIQSGEIEAGARLRQAEVARRFGVSTTPVREAFALLAREGLVVHTTHRGALVFRPTLSDLRENYEIRLALEPLATEIAAREISDAALTELSDLLKVMERQAESAAYARLNRGYHAGIYAAARRPKLAGMIESLRDAAVAYMQVLVTTQPNTPAAAQIQHRRIFEALKARAPEQAAEAMRDHLSFNLAAMTAGLMEVAGEREAEVVRTGGRPSGVSS